RPRHGLRDRFTRHSAIRNRARSDQIRNFEMTSRLIATQHNAASDIGAQNLRARRNAINAAIAADAALCVVYPHMTSVAGDLMAIVWAGGETSPVGLIGAGRSGELATIGAVRARGHESMPARGVLPVTVPGTVEAWGRLLGRFG